jgi:outer membrane protein TolC
LAQVKPLPVLPAKVAVGDPADLLARRPDVRAAERLLAAQTAQVGVARAKLRPRLSFTGILGMGSSSITSIVDPATAAYGILPQIKWSGLDWGKGQASVAQAKAQRDSAQAQYRRAVLTALEDAESSLSRFGAARERLMQLEAGEGTAQSSARLGAQRVSAGTSSKLEQTEREAQVLQAAITSAQGRAEVVVDYIAIAKALGLGWEG